MGSLASSYTNFDDLLAGVVSSVQDILEGVAPEIETRLQASIVENVHSKSGRSDGIESKKNIVSSVTTDDNVVTMTVKDIARPQASWCKTPFREGDNAALEGTMFANWIGMGRPKENKPKRPARPFISKVQVEAAMLVKTALHEL